MRHFLLATFFTIILCFSAPLSAQDHESEEAQKAWQQAMTPGEMHTLLAEFTGTWKAKITMWNDPAGEPMVSDGTVESEMMMGDQEVKSMHVEYSRM